MVLAPIQSPWFSGFFFCPGERGRTYFLETNDRSVPKVASNFVTTNDSNIGAEGEDMVIETNVYLPETV